jgi:aryl-alcohol dehydrogenase-like predicted oxidoreductase
MAESNVRESNLSVMNMPTRDFGKTGLTVSALGFGGAPIGHLKVEPAVVSEILHTLLDNGVNLIDTAASYFESEVLIGDAVSHRRGEYTLVSKCGTKLDDIPANVRPYSGEMVTRTIERSLRRLRTDHLDVMILHSCDMETLTRGDALAALLKARDAGKIRFAAYSGDNETAAYAATLPDISVIEISVSIPDQANIETVLPVAAQHNVGVIAKRSMFNGGWLSVAEQPAFYRAYIKPYMERFQQMQLDPRDLGFDGPPAQAWPEIALRFTLSFGGVHTAIVGMTDAHQARQNLASVAEGPLAADILQKIRDAFRRHSPSGQWRGEI